MKIKSKNPKVASMKLIVPIDGEITIDADGVAEVSPKCAIQLVTGTNDWAYASKAKESKATDTVDDEEEDDDTEGGEE